jgi:dinuclear metal center YbgI/SA1388 family protein
MLANGQTIISCMEQFAPKYIAMPNDAIGLQLGTLNKKIGHILIALDVTEEVVQEAIDLGAELIIAHHAIMYRPVKHLRTDLPAGRLFERLIKHDIAVYIAHTNLDVAGGGVNDILAGALGLIETTAIQDIHTEKLHKLAVYVPADHHEKVLQALFLAGAGSIGDYSHCSFNVKGTGTFMPGDGTSPFIGTHGQLERVEEIRIETIVPESLQRMVIQAMLKAHPYEEVAYDLFPLDLKGRTFGLGRIGRLDKQVTLGELAEQVKSAYDVQTLRVVGDLSRNMRKIGVLGGSGRDYVQTASFAGADVLITGDIDYHTAHDALTAGMCIIDAGHNIEKLLKPAVAQILAEKLEESGYKTKVHASKINTEPFQFV